MKYITSLVLFLISLYFHLVLNFYGNGWQYIQPFLISLLLIYFNIPDLWLAYVFAFGAGIMLDSTSALFGFHTISFISIIFILKNLQLTTFTSKNIFTVLWLSIFSFVFYWLLVFLGHSVFEISTYYIESYQLKSIFKGVMINMALLIFMHVWHFNFWVKKHEKQSF
jgi:hypothetical protein